MSGESPTVHLARFASELSYDDLPLEALKAIRLGVLDLLGCGAYGATLEWTRLVQGWAVEQGAGGLAPIWGTTATATASLAALANGTAAHGAEMDDLHRRSFFHPSAAVVPTALAIVGSGSLPVDGSGFIAALAAGYEVGARVGASAGQGHFARGFHPQGTVGAFAAAATAGRLWGLTPAAMADALGIVGSQAAGLMAAQEGGMVKRLHAGHSCRAGVEAAALAKLGFRGTPAVFESGFGGFLSAFGTVDSCLDALTDGLGERFEVADIEFKRHAACAAIHSTLDVLDDLIVAHAFAAGDVDGITIHCSSHSYAHCGFLYHPERGAIGAQMSFQYCAAALLVFGRVSVAEFEQPMLTDPAVLDLARRVEVVVDPTVDARGADHRHAVVVDVALSSGRSLIGAREQRKGGLDEPLTARDVIGKYATLATIAGMPPARVTQLQETVLGLDEQSDVAVLGHLLAGPFDPSATDPGDSR